ncbi:MAG TPA: hypothetical protein VGR48_07360 [Terriglobales bacterium]|nr:hypothetical protein [Terriglobales bacterium]
MPKKKHLPAVREEPVPEQSFPAPARADEPGELKEFVENYLNLADRALGFVRRPAPNNQLTISTCIHCQHTIAATDLKLLGFAENLHVCPAKRLEVPSRKNEAA